MEVGGQLNVPAAWPPRKLPSVRTEWEARWAPEHQYAFLDILALENESYTRFVQQMSERLK